MPNSHKSNQTAPRPRTASNSTRAFVMVALCVATLLLTSLAGCQSANKTSPYSSTILPTERVLTCPESANAPKQEKPLFAEGQTFLDDVALALGETNWRILNERLIWGDEGNAKYDRVHDDCKGLK